MFYYNHILAAIIALMVSSCSADFAGKNGAFSGGSKKNGSKNDSAPTNSDSVLSPCENSSSADCQYVDVAVSNWGGLGDVDESSPGSAIVFSDGTSLGQRCMSSAVKTATHELSYAKTHGSSCDWNTGDNLGPVESSETTVRAVRSQVQKFQMPQNAILCSLSLESKHTNIQYDDYMIFVFNDYLVAASQHLESEFISAGLPIKDGLITFDAAKVIGKLPTSISVNKRPTPGYCPPDATCLLPSSELAGAMKFQIPGAWFNQLPVKTLLRSEHQFQVLVTGQGNVVGGAVSSSDCGHSGFDLTAKVTYVLP